MATYMPGFWSLNHETLTGNVRGGHGGSGGDVGVFGAGEIEVLTSVTMMTQTVMTGGVLAGEKQEASRSLLPAATTVTSLLETRSAAAVLTEVVDPSAKLMEATEGRHQYYVQHERPNSFRKCRRE